HLQKGGSGGSFLRRLWLPPLQLYAALLCDPASLLLLVDHTEGTVKRAGLQGVADCSKDLLELPVALAAGHQLLPVTHAARCCQIRKWWLVGAATRVLLSHTSVLWQF
ncbi:TPA: hypothetical protein ACH3X2_008883, partial [Trebouxia sp. C0005]